MEENALPKWKLPMMTKLGGSARFINTDSAGIPLLLLLRTDAGSCRICCSGSERAEVVSTSALCLQLGSCWFVYLSMRKAVCTVALLFVLGVSALAAPSPQTSPAQRHLGKAIFAPAPGPSFAALAPLQPVPYDSESKSNVRNLGFQDPVSPCG
jgi:hypothetical protein